MRRRLYLLLLAVLVILPGALSGDAIVIAGAGWLEPWDTEIELANVSDRPIEVFLSSVSHLPLGVPCPPACNAGFYTVPGRGTKRVLTSDFMGTIYLGAQMIRVELLRSEGPLPVVRARVFNRSTPLQATELPVTRESSIDTFEENTLVFPGAVRASGFHSNLILQTVGARRQAAGVEVLVEAFGSDGTLLGTMIHRVPGVFASRAFTLVDVLESLRVSDARDVQVRVTKLSGPGSLWGILTTVGTDGTLRAAAGAHP